MARLIRLPEVIRQTGLSRSGIYLRLSPKWEGPKFPEPISLDGGRAVAFFEPEIQAWIEAQIQAARAERARAERPRVGA